MTWGTGSTSNARSGLTLLELILVMALLLMVLAMAAPRVGDFSRGRVLVSHAEVVLAMLQNARDRSAAEAVVYRVQADDDGGGCRLYRRRGGTFEPLEESGGRHKLPQGIRVAIERSDAAEAGDAAEPAFVEFLPTGECTPASVRLTDDGRPAVVLTTGAALEPFRLIEEGKETL